MNKSVIVIPVHSASPSQSELASFAQCFKVLQLHPIKVLAPDHLDLNKYREIVSEFEVLFIEPTWQSSLEAYNRLKVSKFFYDLFKEYQFILTYELDAWVFNDELNYWSGRGYDYIGAPWFKGYSNPDADLKIEAVGNSGFSLRNIKSSLELIRQLRIVEVLGKYKNLNSWGLFTRAFPFLYQLYNAAKTPSTLEKTFRGHEDSFWCLHAPRQVQAFSTKSPVINTLYNRLLKNKFKIAGINEAIPFSFEVHPRHLYKLNNYRLPFGCHAWEKYDPEFWSQFISITPKARLHA